jgi:hypothetical protein
MFGISFLPPFIDSHGAADDGQSKLHGIDSMVPLLLL